MFTGLLLATLALSAPATAEVEEVWEGKLYVEYVEAKPKKHRVKRNGDVLPLTIRITRKGNNFTGEWIEGNRSLAIEGTLGRGEFNATPTSVLKGEWNNDILTTLELSGEYDKKGMSGQLQGVGNRKARGGQFELKKKVSKPSKPRERS